MNALKFWHRHIVATVLYGVFAVGLGGGDLGWAVIGGMFLTFWLFLEVSERACLPSKA